VEWAAWASRALSDLIDPEPKLWILVLTRLLRANRYPLRSKTLQSPAFPSKQIEGRLRAAFFFGFFGDNAGPVGSGRAWLENTAGVCY
jgi:hypothetical protein